MMDFTFDAMYAFLLEALSLVLIFCAGQLHKRKKTKKNSPPRQRKG